MTLEIPKICGILVKSSKVGDTSYLDFVEKESLGFKRATALVESFR